MNQTTTTVISSKLELVEAELAGMKPLDHNPAAVYLASLRPTGRRSQMHALNVIANMIHSGATAFTLLWGELRYQHTVAVSVALQERGYSAATVNRSLSALRGVLKEAWNLGLMGSEEYHRAVNLKSVRGETLPAGRALTGDELTRLLEVCWQDASVAGLRDAALIALLYSTGLRRSEVVKLTLADWNASTGTLTIRGGKGNKDRLGYAVSGAAQALTDWLAVRGPTSGPLFVAVHKSGQLIRGRLGTKLRDQTVLDILAKRGQEAHLEPFSPHDFRRTFIGDLLDAGADIVTVQKLAGHAGVGTTARYDRRGEQAKQQAVDLLRVPLSYKRLELPEQDS